MEESWQKEVSTASSPFHILALTLEHSAELDIVTAVMALERLSRHPQRNEVERDMRLSKLIFDINFMVHRNRNIRPRELARCAAAYVALGVKQPGLMFCLAAETCKRLHDFRVSELVAVLFAFGLAGIHERPMLEAVTKELTMRVDDCRGQELGELAWALALLRFRSGALLLAVSDRARSVLRDFDSTALARLLWCLDAFGYRTLCSDLLHDALQVFREKQVQEEMPEFFTAACVLGTVPGSWALPLDRRLHSAASTLVAMANGHAVTASELQGLAAHGVHLGARHTHRVLRCLGVQASSGRSVSSPWLAECRALVESIFDDGGPVETFPMIDREERVSLPVVEKESYAKSMAEFGVDNFGKIGGRCLLNQIGIGKSEENWTAHAKQYVNAWADGVGRRADDWKANTVHRRIYVFAEFHFASTLWPMGTLLEGTSFHLNGLRSDPETARKPWLCAVPLPISKWVDRTLCAEFQLLTEVCEMINRTGIEMSSPELRHSLYGILNMYLCEPSCVSCVGSFKQFQTLFPGVDMMVDCSSVVEPLMARTELDLAAREREDAEERAPLWERQQQGNSRPRDVPD